MVKVGKSYWEMASLFMLKNNISFLIEYDLKKPKLRLDMDIINTRGNLSVAVYNLFEKSLEGFESSYRFGIDASLRMVLCSKRIGPSNFYQMIIKSL